MVDIRTQSEILQDTLADIGVSGRVTYRPPHYRLTLSRTAWGRIKAELPDTGNGEPSLAEFLRVMPEPRPFFTDTELATIRRLL